MRLFLLLALAAPAAAQPLDARAPDSDDVLSVLIDTTEATAQAALRVEHARLALARHEHRQATSLARLRPRLDVYVSVATRGLAFPSISSQGYDPDYAAIARWPGDAWGVTVSWTLDQLLDRRPIHRARAAVAVAEARVDLHHARHQARRERETARALAQAARDREHTRRAEAAVALLRVESGFLARRLDAERDLLRLAEMTYQQGETDYAHLARRRLAVLSAEHAHARNAARLDALSAGLDPADLALTTPHPSASDPD